VRSQDRWRELPIFVTTGMSEPDQLAWLESLAGGALIEKPIEIAALIRRLDSVLRPSLNRG
jgi:DNA-binding response OmpR family regulator